MFKTTFSWIWQFFFKGNSRFLHLNVVKFLVYKNTQIYILNNKNDFYHIISVYYYFNLKHTYQHYQLVCTVLPMVTSSRTYLSDFVYKILHVFLRSKKTFECFLVFTSFNSNQLKYYAFKSKKRKYTLSFVLCYILNFFLQNQLE